MVAQTAPAVAGPRQQAWFRALDHARLLNVKPTYIPARDAYRVTSPRAGDTYNIHPVEVDGILTYECDCPAGEHGRVCWHAALVAALPGECRRRAKHRAARQAARELPANVSEIRPGVVARHDAAVDAVLNLVVNGIQRDPLSDLFE